MLRRLLRRHRTPATIGAHESPLRAAMLAAVGVDLVAYESLAQARRDPDAALILEGDWGGQIYAACPLAVAQAHEAQLALLLAELDDRLGLQRRRRHRSA